MLIRGKYRVASCRRQRHVAVTIPPQRGVVSPQADVRISGSPPMRRANCLMRDCSRSLLSGARRGGKVRITLPFPQIIGARGSTPGIAAEML